MTEAQERERELQNIEAEAKELREHVDIAQDLLASGRADNLPTHEMDALEGVTSACDVELETLERRIEKLEIETRNTGTALGGPETKKENMRL